MKIGPIEENRKRQREAQFEEMQRRFDMRRTAAAKKEVVSHKPDQQPGRPNKAKAPVIAEAPGPSPAKFDRTAYQREYMRAWRKKQKKATK